MPKLTIVNVEIKEYLGICQILLSVRKTRSREGDVTECCLDSEAGTEISQARARLHSTERIPGYGLSEEELQAHCAAGSPPCIKKSYSLFSCPKIVGNPLLAGRENGYVSFSFLEAGSGNFISVLHVEQEHAAHLQPGPSCWLLVLSSPVEISDEP